MTWSVLNTYRYAVLCTTSWERPVLMDQPMSSSCEKAVFVWWCPRWYRSWSTLSVYRIILGAQPAATRTGFLSISRTWRR